MYVNSFLVNQALLEVKEPCHRMALPCSFLSLTVHIQANVIDLRQRCELTLGKIQHVLALSSDHIAL